MRPPRAALCQVIAARLFSVPEDWAFVVWPSFTVGRRPLAGRRFDDLFTFVCEPATLIVAWDRVAGNRGNRIPSPWAAA
ncbi:hypothetical protein MSAR_34060 [Mycolicibacterium sarraceniae]|uniref:Uncharacterized protein n=1 Tax=Mycolicibacterium sarraceniae TaxID=1534348 RepID=A0A7I7SUJ8_9MYCO|nr:hypothetical protein MSAR_34060 [Mycolicibacterium sarraceniae]